MESTRYAKNRDGARSASGRPRCGQFPEAADQLFQRSTDYSDDEANEMNARRALESEGVDWLIDFSPQDQRAFLDAAAETWKEAAADAGGEAPNNRSRILRAIGR